MAAAEKRVENGNELYSENSDYQYPYTTSPRKDGNLEITSHQDETDSAIPIRSIGEVGRILENLSQSPLPHICRCI